MFYNKDILTRKKGGFGVIWLAATLGSKSQFKKLSKKEVTNVDVVKACNYVSTPPEPLALRLSSNLMVGITRIYDQQYHFYFSDVNNVVFRLKRSLAALGGAIGDVNMPIREARVDAITMENDAGIDLSVKSKFGENEILMVADGILADNVVPDIYFDFGWVTNQNDGTSSLHTSNGSSVSMASLRQMSHSDTSISLQETKDFDYHLKSGGSRTSGSRLIKSALLQTDLLDHLGDDGGPLLFGDDDFGFLEDEYQPPGTPTKSTEGANIRKKKLDDLHFDVENDHANAVKRGKKFAADGISFDVEMGLDNDPSFEMSYEDTYNPPSVLQESIGGLVTEEQYDGKESEVSLTLNEAVGPHDAEAGQKKQRKRKKGTYKDLMDGVIELSHEEMRSLAQNARIALDEAKAKAQEKAMMKEAESTFNRAFKSVIGMHALHPTLAKFYESLASNEISKRKAIGAPSGENANRPKRRRNNNQDDIDDYPMFDDPGMHFGDTSGSLSNVSSIGNASFEPEQFRALDLESSLDDVNRFALPMPWADPSRISSAPGSASKDSSLGASTVNGGLSILDGFESPASGSIKSELLGRRLSLNTSASRDLPSPTMNDLGEDIPLMFDDWDGHQSKIADVSASQHRESLEKESNNFYLYAKNLMENAGTDNIYFEDIVTMQRKEVAAQGFYHILVLTTQRMIRPKQDTPYGSIRLEF